jgi:hypothetical protein
MAGKPASLLCVEVKTEPDCGEVKSTFKTTSIMKDTDQKTLNISQLSRAQRDKVAEMVRHREPGFRDNLRDDPENLEIVLDMLKPSTICAIGAFITKSIRKKPRMTKMDKRIRKKKAKVVKNEAEGGEYKEA